MSALDGVRLADCPPYCAWMLHKDPTALGPWGVKCASGYNAVLAPGGGVFLPSRETAEAVIRRNGFTPGPEQRG